MSQSEAWSLALLGLGVVFACGGITVLCARLFGYLAQRASAAAVPHSVSSSSDAASTARQEIAPTEPVPDDVLAVICAVLEVESKLYLGPAVSKMTIRRQAPQY
jgi:Na+-transporting methylmalonyl-CoA/oxaloacetate decarboxylase gamma subunit